MLACLSLLNLVPVAGIIFLVLLCRKLSLKTR